MYWMKPARTISRTVGRTSPPAAGEPHLFLTLRCDRPIEPGARFCLRGADVVMIGRGDSLSIERREEDGLTVVRIGVPDPRMSSTHARLQSVLGDFVIQDAGSKNGTWLDGRRITSATLPDGALLELGDSFFLYREALPAGGPEFLDGRELRPAAERLATLSPVLDTELDRLAVIARSTVPILVRGETGTGKEVIASAIHQLSGRRGRFIAVNCGALPEHLVESELFGYRKGAFSGAAEDRPGLVRSSDQGTLLLDEIGDLPLSAQPALLRVLQEEEVLSVGSTHPVKVDLRVVASTHRDLDALATEERFRPDLLARLAGHSLLLPPLRERREDLGLLIAALLRKLAGDAAGGVTFTPEAARALLLHRWPLNIRELEKCLSGAIVLAREGVIELEHLPASLRAPPQDTRSATPATPRLSKQEEERRRHDDLVALLREHDGNVTAVARAMGKPRTQVQRWLRRLRVDPLSFRR
jgi:sigma-54 dependent transcriptional regulator, acetoin dehydrogenase operon transcriptional activator AcoR